MLPFTESNIRMRLLKTIYQASQNSMPNDLICVVNEETKKTRWIVPTKTSFDVRTTTSNLYPLLIRLFDGTVRFNGSFFKLLVICYASVEYMIAISASLLQKFTFKMYA